MLEQNRAELEKAGVLWWHERGFRGKGVTVAVLDKGCPRENQKDYVEFPIAYTDKTDHGCNTCAVIHAVAPEAKIVLLPFREESIDYILEHNIKLVNISLNYDIRREFVERLEGKASVCCSAGNDWAAPLRYPASYNWPIVVCAYFESGDKPASYSQSGEQVDIASYTNIAVETDEGKIFEFNGTSAASPFVCGMAAVFYGACVEAGIDLTVDMLDNYVLDNAVDVYEEGIDLKTGRGLFVLPERLPIKLQYKIGGDDYIRNGEHLPIDVSPFIKNNRLMLTARNVAENLGCEVDYDKDLDYEVEITRL